MIMILQYSVLIVIIYGAFLVSSIVLLPLAYLRSVGVKLGKIGRATSIKETIMFLLEFVLFLCFGSLLLIIGFFSDFYYFWANNFRSNLKKIIIEREDSTLENSSIR